MFANTAPDSETCTGTTAKVRIIVVIVMWPFLRFALSSLRSGHLLSSPVLMTTLGAACAVTAASICGQELDGGAGGEDDRAVILRTMAKREEMARRAKKARKDDEAKGMDVMAEEYARDVIDSAIYVF